MAKVRNMHLRGTPEQVKAWKEESDFIGRNLSRIEEPGHLVIYALPPKRKSRKEKEEEAREERKRRGNGFTRTKKVDNDD
jgi:hypothetical protein